MNIQTALGLAAFCEDRPYHRVTCVFNKKTFGVYAISDQMIGGLTGEHSIVLVLTNDLEDCVNSEYVATYMFGAVQLLQDKEAPLYAEMPDGTHHLVGIPEKGRKHPLFAF